MIGNVILIIIGFALLVKGADLLVLGASKIAKKFNIPEIIIGLTVVAIGTSLPELVVSTTSALTGHSDIALGNVVGSNIANLFLILGICSAVRPLKFKKETISLDDLFAKINAGQKEINVVLKADVRGSEEAVKNALEKIEVEDVRVKVIRSGIGTITESDVVLANASDAIIIGFNVIPSNITKEVAKEYGVDIRLYTIIYKAVEEMELAMKGMLDPEFEEKILGTAEIRKIFKFSKIGNIAGCYITDGLVKNNAHARLIRDGVVVIDTKIASVQREKDTVKEVKKGFECGITLDNYSDIKEGDTIEVYEMVEVKR